MNEKHRMSEEAREARNAYLRKWRHENPDKARAIRERYWERKAQRNEKGGEQDE